MLRRTQPHGVFLPKMHNLNLIIKKHQKNPDRGTFYKKELAFHLKIVEAKKKVQMKANGLTGLGKDSFTCVGIRRSNGRGRERRPEGMSDE